METNLKEKDVQLKPMNVYQKINALRAGALNIKKNKNGSGKFGFEYYSLKAIYQYLNKFCLENDLFWTTNFVNDDEYFSIDVVFINVDDTKEVVFNTPRFNVEDNNLPKGQAAQQKGSNMTYAVRYALTFALGLNDDYLDPDNEKHNPVSETQINFEPSKPPVETPKQPKQPIETTIGDDLEDLF